MTTEEKLNKAAFLLGLSLSGLNEALSYGHDLEHYWESKERLMQIHNQVKEGISELFYEKDIND